MDTTDSYTADHDFHRLKRWFRLKAVPTELERGEVVTLSKTERARRVEEYRQRAAKKRPLFELV